MNTALSSYESNKRICFIGDTGKDSDSVTAAQSFAVPVIFSEDGSDLTDDHNWQTCFVLDDFDSSLFETLNKDKKW